MLPLVALLGRTNVGKSTLFNRLLGSRKSLTHDHPGVTRDRIYGVVDRGPRPFALVDTGGLQPDSGEGLEEAVFHQALEALEEAQLLVLVVDGRQGLTELDRELAEYLRKARKPVRVAVNKVDGAELEERLVPEFHEMGFDVHALSAEHGYGVPDFLEELCRNLPSAPEAEQREEGLRLALLGRPNAGKSSLINAFVGEKRLIVDSESGTTRDSIDVILERGDKRYIFIDTAGVRRRSRVRESLERISVLRALKTSNRADVSILLMDALQGVTSQDKKILDYLTKEKVPVIAAVNKIDLVPKPKLGQLKKFFEQEMSFCPHLPLIYTSSVSKSGLGGILPLAEKLWAQYTKRVSTGELNRCLQAILERHQPPMAGNRRPRFYYMTQPEVAPPTFVFFMNDHRLIGNQYTRYLEKQLRKYFKLEATPLRLLFRTSRG
jgi:GTP-binding protein